MEINTHRLPPLIVRLLQCQATPPDCTFTAREITTLVDAERLGEFTLFDAVSLDEATQLYSTVRSIRPTHSAEIGFCCGGSGLTILQALADNENGAVHHACDPFQSTYAKNAGLRNVEAAGLSRHLRFHEAFPEVVFPDLPRLQFAFIDASHLFDLSMLDFVLVDKKLDIGGIVAFHDLWMPSLRKVIRFLLANRGYEIICSNTQTLADSGVRSLAKRFMSRFLRVLPRANDIFCPELLEPWEEFGIGNLALLRKTSDDSRDWRHFQRF